MDRLKSSLLETFNDKKIGKILDVGTGRGSFVEILVECFEEETEITGIDMNDEFLEFAKERFKGKNVNFLNMNAAVMEFEDSSFDVVCISNTIHHIPDSDKVLNEMKRVLKPQGYFIINEMFCDNQSEKQLSHVKLHHLGAEIDTDLDNFHDKTYEKDEIISIAHELGLDIVKMFEYLTHEEQTKNQNDEDEKKILDSVFDALEKKIEKIDNVSKQKKYKEQLGKLSGELYDIGFFLATELIVIAKNIE